MPVMRAKPLFTPVAIDPVRVQISSWAEIQQRTPGPLKLVSDVLNPPKKKQLTPPSSATSDEDAPLVPTSRSTKAVFVSEDYAIKVFQNNDGELSNEIFVGSKLNELIDKHMTHVFVKSHGYLLSMDGPDGVVKLMPMTTYDRKSDRNVAVAPHHYVYTFSERVQFPLEALPDEPQINEDFFFEILIGLYYARKTFVFSHRDIHAKNLMFNRLDKPTDRSYKIGDGVDAFYVNINQSSIEPKLIDYGKSVVDPTYTDAQWKLERYKRFWFTSDIHHLAKEFDSYRPNLSPQFRDFLNEHILTKYESYPRNADMDSAANYQNIEALLRIYFKGEK